MSLFGGYVGVIMKKLFTFVSILTISQLSSVAAHAQQQMANRLVSLLLNGDQAQIEKLYSKPSANFSQSDAHAFSNYRGILRFSFYPQSFFSFVDTDYFFCPGLKDTDTQRCFKAFYAQEIKENQKDRHTFVYAQKWEDEWFAALYKTLYEATTIPR